MNKEKVLGKELMMSKVLLFATGCYIEDYTCSLVVESIDTSDARICYECISTHNNLPCGSVDEVLVVHNDKVIRYAPKDWE